MVPLLIAVLINLPLVIDRIESFYRHSVLQNLRADFHDLDQHLASRHEMVRLLAKLPEPGILMDGEDATADQIDLARAQYTEWINRVLSDQLDILQIDFFDHTGASLFWLERNQETRFWEPTLLQPELPSKQDLMAVIESKHNAVLLTPVRIDQTTRNPARAMTLKLLASVDAEGAIAGVVSIMIDIGGLARRDSGTHWVLDDGKYLQAPGLPTRTGSAFAEYPGLKDRFAAGEIALWEGEQGRQVIWVPLLSTDDGRPLWVGRTVNRKPLDEFRHALIVRVLSIVFVLVVIILLFSQWFAWRMEAFSRQLTDGIGQVLGKNKAVTFSWKGTQELEQLGKDLSKLSETHVRNARNLQAHTQELEASNRYKSQFLANVSHELRTPLNSVLLLSKLLSSEEANMDEKSRQQARVINHASNDLKSLIDNILDLSRIEAGRQELHLEEINLTQLLTDLLELLRPQFDAKNLLLRLHVTDDAIETIQSDRVKIRQVIKNFLSNAVKFTTSGEVTVELSRVDGDRPIMIRVSDTGIGIPEEKQELIFEAFQQADGTTSRRFGGTGLGLTISRELVQMMGGEIQVESEPAKGSSFIVTLPTKSRARHRASLPQVLTETEKEVQAEPLEMPEANFQGCQILLISRDLQLLLHLTSLLESWGLEVLAAGDEQEALETLAEMDCRVVLVDTGILAEEGYARIRKLRKLYPGDSLIMVALREGDSDEQQGSDIEVADETIQKPVEPNALHTILHRYLG